MQINDYVSVGQIIRDASVGVGDPEFKNGLTIGWYKNELRNILDRLAFTAKLETVTQDIIYPDGDRFPEPEGAFNIREIYGWNGECWTPNNSEPIWWKREFNNQPFGNGYTALRKDNLSNGFTANNTVQDTPAYNNITFGIDSSTYTTDILMASAVAAQIHADYLLGASFIDATSVGAVVSYTCKTAANTVVISSGIITSQTNVPATATVPQTGTFTIGVPAANTIYNFTINIASNTHYAVTSTIPAGGDGILNMVNGSPFTPSYFNGIGQMYNTIYYFNVQNGIIMLSETCRQFENIRVIYSGTMGKIDELPCIPRFYWSVCRDSIKYAYYQVQASKDPKSFMNLVQMQDNILNNPRTGSWWQALAFSNKGDAKTVNDVNMYNDRGNW